MRRSPFIVFILSVSCAFAQSYRVTPVGAVVSDSNCYSFQAPEKWKIAAGNPAPLFFDFPPRTRVSSLQQLPKGTASLSVVSGRDSGEKPESIDHWMELRNRAHSFSSVQEVQFAANTGITRAVKVLWADKEDLEPGEPITQTVAVFFEFQGHPFAAYLSFYLDDRRREEYLKALTGLLESFRPLTNAQETSGGCSSSRF